MEATTWDGKRVVLMGDAYMRSQDAELAAIAVRLSMEQLLDIASGTTSMDYFTTDELLPITPNNFNVCTNNFMPKLNIKGTQIRIYWSQFGVKTMHFSASRFSF